eukprot:m.267162 g.267162  ORF g.267162 m.267162 type:complete len:60 (-) comp19725_c0_seq6:404-583(-)
MSNHPSDGFFFTSQHFSNAFHAVLTSRRQFFECYGVLFVFECTLRGGGTVDYCASVLYV